MHFIQVENKIKNTGKIIAFVLLMLTPYWISRFVLHALHPNLVVDIHFDYLWYAVRFDLKSLTIWYSPLFVLLFVGLFYKAVWWRQLCTLIFTLLYLAALVFSLIAVFYFEISKTIVGVELFQLIKGQSFSVIVSYIVDYWWAIFLALVFLWLILKLERKTDINTSAGRSLLMSSILLLIIVFFARGGVALKPLNLMDAYAALPNDVAVSAVTPTYVLIESVGKKTIIYDEYMSFEKLRHELKKDKIWLESEKGLQPNICIILLESFGKEYTSINMVGRKSYTPFLDSLMTVSTNFTNAYANGLRSMDAVASIYCGIPAFMKMPYIGSLYTNSTITSLPLALKKQGYFTSFFHGADELSMGFKPFLMSHGLDEYVGRQQYPVHQDYDGTWGIYDEPFLQYFAQRIDRQKQPWFSGVFTLSSHHPYTVPSSYSILPLGTAPIHQSVGYTDNALRSFFAKVSKQDWFFNTLFVITADHTSINETPAYTNNRGKYAIPLMVYKPNQTPKVDTTIVQHIDLFPTLKSWAGVPQTVSFSKPLYDTATRFVFHFDGNLYTVSSDSFSLVWNGISQPSLFAYKKDYAHHFDVSGQHPKVIAQMMHQLRTFKQKYSYRLLNNNFF